MCVFVCVCVCVCMRERERDNVAVDPLLHMLPLLLLQQMFLPLVLFLLQNTMKNVATLEALVDLAEALHEHLVLLAVAVVLL